MANFNSFDNVSTDEKAGFNMAIETLKRMNSILIELRFARMRKDYVHWFAENENLYMELDSFMNDKERDQIGPMFEKATPFIRAIQQTKTILTKPGLEKNLKEIEILLRRLMQKYDLIMPKKGDLSIAMLG